MGFREGLHTLYIYVVPSVTSLGRGPKVGLNVISAPLAVPKEGLALWYSAGVVSTPCVFLFDFFCECLVCLDYGSAGQMCLFWGSD